MAVASDHAGYALKLELLKQLRGAPTSAGARIVLDLGTDSAQPVDYPDFAEKLGRTVREGHAWRGILICGSGVGAGIAANKLSGVRAGLCHDTYSAHQGVEHDDMNVLALGSRVIGAALALECISAFLEARFTGEERHVRRLAKIMEIERRERVQP